MKSLFFIITLSLSFALCASTKLSPQERELMIQKKVGGFITIESKGKILVLDCQNTFNIDSITNSIYLAQKNLKVPFEIHKAVFTLEKAKNEITSKKGTSGIFIVDIESLPLSLISLEETWGMINIAKLRKGAADEVLTKRTAKEFNRVLAVMFGGGLSTQKSSIMRPVTDISDLDKIINVWIPFDTLSVIYNALPEYGLTHTKKIPYIKACKEGWAPAPTNEFQKAIWEKVRSEKERGPANALQIPMPKKK